MQPETPSSANAAKPEIATQGIPDGTPRVDTEKTLRAEKSHGSPMAYLRIADSAHSGLTSSRLRLFWQRWNEALDTRAPVSVAAPTTGARPLLGEWVDLRWRVRLQNHGAESLRAVEEEAFGGPEVSPYPKVPGTLKEDPVFQDLTKGFATDEAGVNRHYALGNPPENIHWSRTQTFAEVMLRRLNNSYIAVLCERVQAAVFGFDDAPIAEGPMQASEALQIDALVTALLSDLLTTGFSRPFLRQHAQRIVLRDAQDSERSRLHEFLQALRQPEKGYTVVLLVQGNAKALSERLPSPQFTVAQDLNQLSLRLRPELDSTERRRGQVSDFQRASPHRAFIVTEVVAMDDIAAVRVAYLGLEQARDLVWAESPEVSAIVTAAATKVSADDAVLAVASFDDAELRFRPTRRSAVASVRQPTGFAARVLAATAGTSHDRHSEAQMRSRRRIAGALRASRIASSQPWLESSLTTLWTALEVLAHEQYGGGIIERVVRSTTPFIGSTKLRDLTDDLAAYLTWSGITGTPSFQEKFGDVLSDHDGGPRPIALLAALTDKKRALQLCHIATPSPLLALRVHKFHSVVQDGKSAAQRVLQTTQRVEWQLRRVYRMRNDVIHGAAFGTAGGQLLSHLQLYTRSILEPITQLLSSPFGPRTIEDAVSLVDGSFHVWIEWMRHLAEPTSTQLAASEERWVRMYQPPYSPLLMPEPA